MSLTCWYLLFGCLGNVKVYGTESDGNYKIAITSSYNYRKKQSLSRSGVQREDIALEYLD